MLGDLRRGLNEYNANLHTGDSTSGGYDNEWLVRVGLNGAQKFIYNLLVLRIREEFLEGPTDLTFSSSSATLPWNFGKIEELRDNNNRKVSRSYVRHLPAVEQSGSDRLYRFKGNTLVLNKSGVSATYKLHYIRKPRDLEQGKAAAGAATSITLAAPAKLIADYYNGITIENITKAWVDEIDDYTAARVATISETAAADDYYGTVSEIPEAFHHLIVPRAILECRFNSSVKAQKPVTNNEIIGWVDRLTEALRAFAGNDQDVAPEEIWCDFAGMGRRLRHDIPGQGYLI
jgi:hypothetical protein